MKLPVALCRKPAARRACAALALLIPAATPSPAAAWSVQTAKVTTAFRGKCEDLVLRDIERADKQILVAAYVFTNREIVKALTEAKKRGVDVQVKIDRKQAELDYTKPIVNALRRGKIPVKTIGMPETYHMHNKFLVIDEERVVTGSHNFTIAASRENWENLVSIQSVPIAQAYAREWRLLKSRTHTRH